MGKFNDLLIEIGVDTRRARNGIKQLDRMFDDLGKSFERSTNNGNTDPFNLNKEKKRVKRYIKEVKRLGGAVEDYNKKLEGLKTSDHFKVMTRDVKKYIRSLRQAKLLLDQLGGTPPLPPIPPLPPRRDRNRNGDRDRDRNPPRRDRQDRARAHEENFRRSAAYGGLSSRDRRRLEPDIQRARVEFILTGDTRAFRNLSADARRFRSELRRLNVVQSGLNDSTRNMVRSYASLFALVEGTNAIKNVGMDFQGMEASMLAATGGEKEAAKDMQFLNGMVDKMGLNLKDTTDAWVKFKFAAKGKIEQGQMEDIFTGLSMFGTSLKVDAESMKRSQKAIIQIRNCLAA